MKLIFHENIEMAHTSDRLIELARKQTLWAVVAWLRGKPDGEDADDDESFRHAADLLETEFWRMVAELDA